jgi:lipopolysaccharide export system protein LptA
LRSIRFAAALGLGLAVGAGQLAAQPLVQADTEEPLEITSDAVEFDQALNVYVARGNVRIEQEGTVLTADWVAFSNNTLHGLASGNVVVVDEEDTLYAEFLQFNIATIEGVAYEGTLENAATGFRMEGDEVRKTEERAYKIYNGLFTTCRCPEEGRDPWAIKAKKTDLEVGGYAVTRNTTLNVLGVPILWSPWAVLPLKRERQSGFLFPEFANSSRRGFEVGVPYFWVVHPQVNLTLTPTWTSDRGPLVKFNVEYVVGHEGRNNYGTLRAIVVPDDQEVEPDSAATPYDALRWGVEFRHRQYDGLPWGLEGKIFANWASDNDVPFDYNMLEQWRRDRFMPSVASLTKHFADFGGRGGWAAVRWADDLQAPDDQDRDEFLLQRLPEAGFTQAASFPSWASRLLTSLDVRYIHFWYKSDPTDELPGSVVVDDLFLDTGIEALPDGLERNDNGDIVTEEGIVRRDGTVITIDEVLDAEEEAADLADEEFDRAERRMELLATDFSLDQSGDNFPPGPEMDGLFQEGEPLADRGHRLLVNPRVALPFRLGDAIEVFPELAYHGTFYQTRLQSFAQRSLISGRVDVRSRLRKTVDLPFGMGAADHLMEPRFTFYGIASLSDSDSNPLFVPQPFVSQERIRQLDIENVLRDPADRIDHVHGVVLGVSNRFYSIEMEREEEEEEEGVERGEEDLWVANRLLADLTTSLEYRTSESAFGWFIIDGNIYPTNNTRLSLVFGWDLDTNELSETQLGATWRTPRGHAVGVRYRFLRDIPRFFEDFSSGERFEDFESGFTQINQIDFGTRWAITPSWAVLFNFRYSFEQSLILTNRVGVEYISKCRCWAIQFTVSDDRTRGIEYRIRYSLLGLGDDTVRPF